MASTAALAIMEAHSCWPFRCLQVRLVHLHACFFRCCPGPPCADYAGHGMRLWPCQATLHTFWKRQPWGHRRDAQLCYAGVPDSERGITARGNTCVWAVVFVDTALWAF